jgi:hypothetical protein
MNTTRHHRLLSLPASLALLAASACGGSTANPGSAPGDGGTEGALGDGAVVVPEGGGSDGGDQGDDAGSGLPTIKLYSCSLDGIAYTVGATIGTQQFQLTVDTGSTTLGVASTSCSTCTGVKPEYSPGASAVDEKKTATSQYGTGSWTGEIYQDTVALPPSASTPLKFAAIDTQSMFFESIPCDSTSGSIQGIVGFAPATLAVPGTQGLLDQLVVNQKLPDIFATELCETGGSMWLGGYDPAATTAAPQYTPFATTFYDAGYYGVNLVSITVGTTTVPVASAQYADSLVDTGTSIFALGTTAYNALVAAIGADPGFTKTFGGAAFFGGQTPCAATTDTKATLDSTLPELTLTFGTNPAISVKATATESYLFQYQGVGWCSAIQGFDQGTEAPVAAIMGAPVLRSNVLIFDRVQKRLGFAPHTACD